MPVIKKEELVGAYNVILSQEELNTIANALGRTNDFKLEQHNKEIFGGNPQLANSYLLWLTFKEHVK